MKSTVKSVTGFLGMSAISTFSRSIMLGITIALAARNLLLNVDLFEAMWTDGLPQLSVILQMHCSLCQSLAEPSLQTSLAIFATSLVLWSRGVLAGGRPVCSMPCPTQREVLLTQADFRYQMQRGAAGGCISFLSASGLTPGPRW